MALPFSFSSELKWSQRIGGSHGFVEYSGSYYVVLCDATNNHIEVWKTTDGTTGEAWAEQDSGNHPGNNTTADKKSVDAVVLSSKIYVAFTDDTTEAARVIPFDMATDTWGTATTTSNAPVPPDASHASGKTFWRLAVLADGDYIIMYQGTASSMGTAYRTVVYKRYSSSAWDLVQGIIANKSGSQKHCDGYAIIRESSTRAHFVYTNTTDSDLHSRAVSSGSIQTEQTVDAAITTGNWVVGEPTLDGSDLVIPYVDGDGSLAVGRATGADNPTWSVETGVSPTSTSDPEYTTANAGALVVSSGTVHAIWPDDTTLDIYRDNDGGASTWGTDSEWKDAVTCNGVNAVLVTNAIAVLYDDGGTVKFDKIALTSTQTVVMNTIASGNTVNSPKVAYVAKPGTIASTVAVNNPAITCVVRPDFIASTLALYNATIVPGAVTIGMNAIASTVAVNSQVVAQVVKPGTIAAGSTLQQPAASYVVKPGTIAAGSAVNNQAVSYVVKPGTIASTATLNEQRVAQGISPGTIASGHVVRNQTVVPGPVTVATQAIGTTVALNNQTVTPGAVAAVMQSIGATTTLYQPGLSYVVKPGTIVAGTTLNNQTIAPGAVAIAMQSIASGHALYNLAATPGAVTVAMQTIASGHSLYQPEIVPGAVVVVLQTIGSTAALNGPSVAYVVTPGTIASGHSLNNQTIVPGAVTAVMQHIASTAALHNPAVSYVVKPGTISSGHALYQPTVATGGGAQAVSMQTIASGHALNAPSLGYVVKPGTISSGHTLYTPSAAYVVKPGTITSGHVLNDPTIVPGAVTIVAQTIGSTTTLYAVRVFIVARALVVGSADDASATGSAVLSVSLVGSEDAAASTGSATLTGSAVGSSGGATAIGTRE